MEGSKEIHERVVKTRLIQEKRFIQREGVHCNAQMESSDVRGFCRIEESGSTILKTAMDKLGLSARAYDRIIQVARFIANLEVALEIERQHFAEAINFRSLDFLRSYFALRGAG